MKILKLPKFKTNPNLQVELADKMTDKFGWQNVDFTQYPSLLQMFSDNNLVNVGMVTISSAVGPGETIKSPTELHNDAGEIKISPFKLWVPIGGTTSAIFKIGDESAVIDMATLTVADEEMTAITPPGTTHMLRIFIVDSESTGRFRYMSQNSEHKMEAFAKFFGLV